MSNIFLEVPHGQLTFDAEGNNVPGSPYYSRVAHCPGGISGVTIGRGYDLGHRGSKSTIVSEFEQAGVAIGPWEGAIGLKGSEAQTWLSANKSSLPEITLEQQYKLFNFSYNALLADVKRISSKADVLQVYGATDFNTLNPAIQDTVADLRFRGDYSGTTRKRVQPCMVNNDLPGLYEVIKDRDFWRSVPQDRFNRRVAYLEKALQGGGAASAATANTPRTYTVQGGDSLSGIAQKFNVSVDALKTANSSKLKTWGSVQGFNAGEEISIP